MPLIIRLKHLPDAIIILRSFKLFFIVFAAFSEDLADSL